MTLRVLTQSEPDYTTGNMGKTFTNRTVQAVMLDAGTLRFQSFPIAFMQAMRFDPNEIINNTTFILRRNLNIKIGDLIISGNKLYRIQLVQHWMDAVTLLKARCDDTDAVQEVSSSLEVSHGT